MTSEEEIVAEYRRACEEWGATSRTEWLDRVNAAEEKVLALVTRMTSDDLREDLVGYMDDIEFASASLAYLLDADARRNLKTARAAILDAFDAVLAERDAALARRAVPDSTGAP